MKMIKILESEGFTRGDRLILSGNNSIEYLIKIFACFLAGIVVIPVDPHLPIEERVKLQKRFSAKELNSLSHSQLKPIVTLDAFPEIDYDFSFVEENPNVEYAMPEIENNEDFIVDLYKNILSSMRNLKLTYCLIIFK